ncbi:MAG: type I restriction endonuclease subunit R [Candidatus Cloacimonetes bacterium]|nr:type I restriction endonuclease subunit R [Candidatus Cloacimonadota bacterium]
MSLEYSEDQLIEQTSIKLFKDSLGWETILAYDAESFGPDGTLGRKDKREIILTRYFLDRIREFNPGLPESVYSQALDTLVQESSIKTLGEMNREKYLLLRDGIPISYTNAEGKQVTVRIRVFDFNAPENNHFLAVRQMWIDGKSHRLRRPDIIGYVNGIPLLFIELKAAHVKLDAAYTKNLADYKDVIPRLFYCNAFIILSNGLESRIGSITAKYRHFHEWKRITEGDNGIVSLDRIILGVCEKSRFLDLFENFILFDSTLDGTTKLIAHNHQFIGVIKALESFKAKQTLYAEGKISLEEKQKLGVFWHTQGSGKSYSMVFLCQKIHRKLNGAYTFLIVTDRNELDKQIYETFSGAGAVPYIKAGARNSIRAQSGAKLKALLKQNHRYIFTLIHKFNFSDPISQRDDIIVISDEAHRTQGGQLALNMRKSMPNASFIGFTGTPLFKDDQITRRIFGDYVSKYDFKRSVDDGATVPLYYENRGEFLNLRNPKITEQIRTIIDETEDLDSDQRSKLERLFYREYPILTSHKRLDAIARDVVEHFCNRGYKGKAMMVTLDKLNTVRMYNLISQHWQAYAKKLETEIRKGVFDDQETLEQARNLKWIKETEIAVVVSSEQNEIAKFKAWNLDIEPHRAKMNDPTRDLEKEFKDEDHPFRLVIVCAMWITGFDVPTLSTMYIDKPLKSHTLMQAIARANRLSEGKENGLIVDYIETYKALLDALAIYGTDDSGTGDDTGNQGEETPVQPIEELIRQLEGSLDSLDGYLLEELEFDIGELVAAKELQKIALLEAGINAIYKTDQTKVKFQVMAREIFQKYKALMPNTILFDYKPRKDAVEALYNAINAKIESADVSEIMKKIQDVVDKSIETMLNNATGKKPAVIDLSGLNMDIVLRMFQKAKNKNIAVQSLKDRIEARLNMLIVKNPLRADFQQKYLEIIDEYNKGKDETSLIETFRKLMEFVESLTDEETQTIIEGLTEEQKAVFDILRKQDLSENDKTKVKKVAVELLDTLKKDKLKIDRVWEKALTAAAVYTTVNQTLFDYLPFPAYHEEDIETKTNLLMDHLKNQYYGGGLSVYGAY